MTFIYLIILYVTFKKWNTLDLPWVSFRIVTCILKTVFLLSIQWFSNSEENLARNQNYREFQPYLIGWFWCHSMDNARCCWKTGEFIGWRSVGSKWVSIAQGHLQPYVSNYMGVWNYSVSRGLNDLSIAKNCWIYSTFQNKRFEWIVWKMKVDTGTYFYWNELMYVIAKLSLLAVYKIDYIVIIMSPHPYTKMCPFHYGSNIVT